MNEWKRNLAPHGGSRAMAPSCGRKPRITRTRVEMRAFMLLVSLAVVTIACGGGNSSPTSPSPSAGTPPAASGSALTFKVDGVSQSATSVTAGLANGILSIGGTDSSRATTLSFALTPTAAGTGTYTLGPLSAANALILVGNPAQSWQAAVGIGSGTITINTLTAKNEYGTF